MPILNAPFNGPQQRGSLLSRLLRKFWWLGLLLALAALGMWSSDSVTLQGERTIYTANCSNGAWQGDVCSGALVAGDRYRFRALKTHREVFFWTVGNAADPTGKLLKCDVVDGRNWDCPPNAAGPTPITLSLKHGKPMKDATGKTRVVHPVSKLTWFLLGFGITWSNTATAP
jgi:hypothetical protein